MSASRRRTVIVSVAALVVAVVLVAAAGTGPAGLVGDLNPDSPGVSEPRQAVPDPDPPTERADDEEPPSQSTELGKWLQDLLIFAFLLIGLALTTGALRLIASQLTRRLGDKQFVLDLEPLPDIEAGREKLRRDRERHDSALAGSDVRNGIVACRVLLEETASEIGVTRQPSETSTEFVIRFLRTLDVDPRPVGLLAGLFQEARFSTHPLPGDARSRAEQALAGIHADLDRSAAT